MSYEHKSANYNYSKKSFGNKSYNVNFIIQENHILSQKRFYCEVLRKTFSFLHGKSVLRKNFIFENPFFENMYFLNEAFFENIFLCIGNHFWKIFFFKHFLKKLFKIFVLLFLGFVSPLKTYFDLLFFFLKKNRFFVFKNRFRKTISKKTEFQM